MPNSIDFYKGVFLHVIPVRIIPVRIIHVIPVRIVRIIPVCVLFLFHDQIVKSISFKYKKAVSKGINSGL